MAKRFSVRKNLTMKAAIKRPFDESKGVGDAEGARTLDLQRDRLAF